MHQISAHYPDIDAISSTVRPVYRAMDSKGMPSDFILRAVSKAFLCSPSSSFLSFLLNMVVAISLLSLTRIACSTGVCSWDFDAPAGGFAGDPLQHRIHSSSFFLTWHLQVRGQLVVEHGCPPLLPYLIISPPPPPFCPLSACKDTTSFPFRQTIHGKLAMPAGAHPLNKRVPPHHRAAPSTSLILCVHHGAITNNVLFPFWVLTRKPLGPLFI